MTSNPKTSLDWAYEFQCDLSLEALLDALEANGPWSWTQRESYVEGSYINCRPDGHSRIKINKFPQGFVDRDGQEGFSALIRTSLDHAAARQALDRSLKELLKAVGATELVAIEPYD